MAMSKEAAIGTSISGLIGLILLVAPVPKPIGVAWLIGVGVNVVYESIKHGHRQQ